MTLAQAPVFGGRYRLHERIAVGGMGEVWRADDELLGRSVAVKVLREEYADDPQFQQRFRDEARHAAQLLHPNVAQVYDCSDGNAGEPPFLVLELIDGEPLSELIARDAPLSAEMTSSVLRQTASALQAAHEAGLVHRDIKPANLLVCNDGTVKVTDFGIARAISSAAVTRTGFLIGTAHYLSPEQAAGEAITPASDMYALGVVGYECLTGQRPFEGEAIAVVIAHRERQPPPLPDGVPGDLCALVGALLGKDPAFRPSAGQVAGEPASSMRTAAPALASIPGPAPGATAELSIPSAKERTAASWRAATIAAAAVALLVVAVVVLTGGGRSGSHTPTGKRAAATTAVPVAMVTLPPGSSADDHPEEARLAADGNATTAWYTQHYATATFGGLRSGSGLLFELSRAARVRDVHLLLSVPGTDLRIYAGDSPSGLTESTPVASQAAAPGDLGLTLGKSVSARYWLVWFTRLAPSDGAFRAGIREASFRS